MSYYNNFISKLRQAGLQPSLTAAMASKKLANVDELFDNNSNNNLLPENSIRGATDPLATNSSSQVTFSASELEFVGFIPNNTSFYETPQGFVMGQEAGVYADDDSDATEAFSDEDEEELPSISSVPVNASFFEIPQGFIIGREAGVETQPRNPSWVPINRTIIGVPTVHGTYIAVAKPEGGVELRPAWENDMEGTEAFSDVDMEEAPIQASPSKTRARQGACFCKRFCRPNGKTLGSRGKAGNSADEGLTSPVKNKRKRTSEAGNNASSPKTKRRKTAQEDEEINVPLGDVQILGVETPEPAYSAPKPARSRSSSLSTAISMSTVRTATPKEFRPKSPETATVRTPTPEVFRPKSPEAVLREAGVATQDWAYPGPYPNGGKRPASPPPKAQEKTDITKTSPTASQVAAADSFLRRLSSELASRPQEGNMTAEGDNSDGSASWPTSPSARMAKEDEGASAQEKGTVYEGPSLAPQLAALDTAYLPQSTWYHKRTKVAAWARTNAVAPGTPAKTAKRKATADDEDVSIPAPKRRKNPARGCKKA
ncbi:hypothetical protein V8F33_005889 [Rhypophila sp. PSN 637]